MSLCLSPFRIAPGQAVDLEGRPTRITPVYEDKADYRERIERAVAHIGERHRALYAERRSALLVILQATDAAGKDGVIRHVFSGVNPQGCRVDNFEPPSRAEMAHDFLWRTTLRLPPHGYIGVFNRSYYEEVLVVRVNLDLLAGEGVQAEGERLWRGRFRSILDHEAHLGAQWRKGAEDFSSTCPRPSSAGASSAALTGRTSIRSLILRTSASVRVGGPISRPTRPA